MEKDIDVWLSDIQQAITEINQFLPEPKIYQIFQSDLKARRAIERNLEIIGEAVNRVLSHNPNISISNSRKIVDTRNRISHGYDSVSDEIIWAIVIRHLPLLQIEIEALRKK